MPFAYGACGHRRQFGLMQPDGKTSRRLQVLFAMALAAWLVAIAGYLLLR